MSDRTVALIWAQAGNGVIGRDGSLPWHLPEDMAHFRETTRGATVLMGRRTWQSLPPRFRPLPGRRNVVLSRSPAWSDAGAEVADSVAAALDRADGDVWVIGGALVYGAALPYATRVVRTDLDEVVEGDAYAPELDGGWRCVHRDPPDGWHTSRTGLRYRVTHWERPAPPIPPGTSVV